jgi:hypothetical protein
MQARCSGTELSDSFVNCTVSAYDRLDVETAGSTLARVENAATQALPPLRNETLECCAALCRPVASG